MDNSYLNDARTVEADLTAFMQDIIRIPSLSSQEGNVIARIREEMEKLGYDEVTVDPMGNLIGRIGSGPRRPEEKLQFVLPGIQRQPGCQSAGKSCRCGNLSIFAGTKS